MGFTSRVNAFTLPCHGALREPFFVKKRRRLHISARLCVVRFAFTDLCWPGTALITMCAGVQSICHTVDHKRQSNAACSLLVAIVSDFWGASRGMRHQRLLRMGPETPRSAPAGMKFRRGTWNPNPRRTPRVPASLYRRGLPHRVHIARFLIFF